MYCFKRKKLSFWSNFFLSVWAILLFINPTLVHSADTDEISKGFAVLRQMEAALVNLAEEVRPTVVTINPHIESKIKSKRPSSMSRVRPTNTGTGVIIDGKKGLIVTNSHVVKGFENLDVTLFGGKVYLGRLLGMDEETDLAVLRIEPEEEIPQAKLGDSRNLKVGQMVVAVGNPFGLNSTLTLGIVSGLNRENINISRYEDFIQTDASINPGNSGGPLLNIEGEVIGINTAIINYAQNIGFSIPSNMVKKVSRHLIESGEVKRGWLGVGIEPIAEELLADLEIPPGMGVYVNAVFEGDPADKAGVKVGDVILKIGGSPVHSPGNMIRVIGAISPGQRVDLDIIREGRRQFISVQMGFYKVKSRLAAKPKMNSPRSMGFLINDLHQELADKYNIKKDKGVVVTDVFPRGSAGDGGLQEGDLIVALNGEKVDSRKQFNKLLRGLAEEESLFLLVERREDSLHITLTQKI